MPANGGCPPAEPTWWCRWTAATCGVARIRPVRPWAWRRVAAGAPIGEVRQVSGWSHASFTRRYRAACGLMPKQHAAVMRFQQALADAALGRPWAEVAVAAGHADQAHLARDFRRLAGMAPGQVRREATAFTNHLRWR